MTTFKAQTEKKILKTGTYLGEFATPGIGQMIKGAGCDFVFVDMEHSGFSFETAKMVLQLLHSAGLATVLRPPTKDPTHLSRACDVGAQGVIPPMLSTPEEARQCIDAIKFFPEGNRGCAFAIAHDDYAPQSVTEAIRSGNDKTSFVALIETKTGINNCREIAALDGVDCLWVGHLDLSMSLGIPGDFENPIFKDAIATVMAAGQETGTSIGRLVGSPEEASKVFQEGCDFVCYLGDIWLFRQALSSGITAIKDTIGIDRRAGDQ